MASNIKEKDFSRTEILLEEPHFDEEATLLSARPVVPLKVVEDKSRSLRRLVVGSAIVAALLIGAFAATLIYKVRGEGQATTVTTRADSLTQSHPSIEAEVVGVESQEPEPMALDTKQPDERAVVENVKPASPPSISSQSPPRVARKGIKSSNENEAQDGTLQEEIDEQREMDKEIRRAERREEHRPRRVEREAKHESRGRDPRSTDDLLRIREIFEGRPRP
jgi:uncharacterized membrane protein